MDIILQLKVTLIQTTMEKHCFGYFGRFLTPGLTLRPPSRYIHVFQTLFGFPVFMPLSLSFER